MNEAIRTMVVDDEQLGRRKILRLLEEDPEIEVLGEYAGGLEAVQAIRERKPDLVFLDIHMPDMDGFDLLRNVAEVHTPTVIFVTAYDQHAVRAFEVHAFDYLLKPFDRGRFRDALLRAKQQLRRVQEGELSKRLLSLLGDSMPRPSAPTASPTSRNRLMVKSNGRITFLRAEEIDWIEAEGDYVCLHSQGRKFLVREKIGGLETDFAPEHFVRIHRSTIVAVDHIKELQPLFYGEYSVILLDGTKLTMSRSYREKVFQRLMKDQQAM
jgi:two-component system LytT family response regulator